MADEDAADFAGGVEELGGVVEDEDAGGVDLGEGEGALVVGAGGFQGIDEVGAEKDAEAVADAHPGEVAIHLPGRLVRAGVECVAGAGKLGDGLGRAGEGGLRPASDVEQRLAGEGGALVRVQAE